MYCLPKSLFSSLKRFVFDEPFTTPGLHYVQQGDLLVLAEDHLPEVELHADDFSINSLMVSGSDKLFKECHPFDSTPIETASHIDNCVASIDINSNDIL